MRFYGEVIARKGKKYWIGRVKRGVFCPHDEEKSLENLDGIGLPYVTLLEYSRIIGLSLTQKQLDDIRKKTGYTDIWVVDKEPPKATKSGDISDTAWERWYFRFLHPLCQDCIHKCKQSSRVDLMCPKYQKK